MKTSLSTTFSLKSSLAGVVAGIFFFLAHQTFAQNNEVADKRLAAFHYSVVCTGTRIPSSAVLTYPVNEVRVQEYNFLLKLMPCLEVEGRIIYPSEYQNVQVVDFPGGIEAHFSFQDTEICTRITPLIAGRGSDAWSGAVLYEVESNDPGKDILVFLGGGSTQNLIWGFHSPAMAAGNVLALNNPVQQDQHTLNYVGGKENLLVGLTSSGTIEHKAREGSSPETLVRISKGEGTVLIAFSDDQRILSRLMKMNPDEEKERITRYYEELLASSIDTPEDVMDQAFTSAIYNLEYSWIEPFGWGECLHHWLALWYMQVTAAADWIGQADRSRSSILEHGLKQFENGAVPMFNPNHNRLGMKRRDWGGGNNYWAWQIRHYVNSTGDREFAEAIIPYLDRTIQQTLEEYDPDGNELIAWGLQIGNQEDFVANPYDGSVPSMELYNMFQTRAELAEFTGDDAAATLCYKKAELVRETLYRELWQNDLGRFAYYKDPTNRILPDGQYQTYLYPLIYDIVDPYDQYSGLRHLRDRLTDDNGAIFASNNFAFHVPESVSTWGMQRGAAQQPWAAMGFAEAGMNNQTWLPLKAMANWAQDPRRPGSWPETGPEITPAYFTPPAGLYISTTIEYLFGLQVFEPKKHMRVSPSFPDHWPGATLNLPDFRVDYSKNGNKVSYTLSASKKRPVKLEWKLPVSRISSCRINGKEMAYRLLPGVGYIELCADIPPVKECLIEIEYEPLDIDLSVQGSIAEGDPIALSLTGAEIKGITDRYGILDRIGDTSPHSFTGTIKKGLLEPYLGYNQLGQLNFSRRTFFLDCTTRDNVDFIMPVDIAVLPEVHAAPVSDVKKGESGFNLPVKIRNNSREAISGEGLLRCYGQYSIFPADIPPRSESILNIPVPSGTDLAAGDNLAVLQLPGKDPLSLQFKNPYRGKRSKFISLALPEKEMIPDTQWKMLRIMPGFPHIFFTFTNYGWPEPMWALEGQKTIGVNEIEGLSFDLYGRKFVPVSHRSGKTSFKQDLEKHTYRKIYLLVLPFVDNHDIFSEVARISLYKGDRVIHSRTLSYPGDVDYWVPDKNPTSFSTLREPRNDRFEMLPLLKENEADWVEGKPPAFPQSKWWSVSHPVVTESCLMSVVEIILDAPTELDYLVFESLGALPAFGIVSVAAEVLVSDPAP